MLPDQFGIGRPHVHAHDAQRLASALAHFLR
jgi:hypothetical protein